MISKDVGTLFTKQLDAIVTRGFTANHDGLFDGQTHEADFDLRNGQELLLLGKQLLFYDIAIPPGGFGKPTRSALLVSSSYFICSKSTTYGSSSSVQPSPSWLKSSSSDIYFSSSSTSSSSQPSYSSCFYKGLWTGLNRLANWSLSSPSSCTCFSSSISMSISSSPFKSWAG